MAFAPGMLVEIKGLSEKAKPVAGATDVQETDLNGVRAQLVEFDREVNKWIAGTFTGCMISVDEKYLKPLTAEDLGCYDFVMGPKSDYDILGSELMNCLTTKGYSIVKMCMASEDSEEVAAAAKKLEEDDCFIRFAPEFEAGYLGKETSGKAAYVDVDAASTPDYIRSSPLTTLDANFTSIMNMVWPYTEQLGFELYSRTNMLVRAPLEDGDADKYTPDDAEDKEAEEYLHLMTRKQMALVLFMGAGKLKMTAKKEGAVPVEMVVEAGTLMIQVPSRCDYTFVGDANSISLSTFFLKEPAYFTLEEITGDVASLGLQTGPPPPPGEQVIIAAVYCREGGGGDGEAQYWNAISAGADGFCGVPFLRWDNVVYYDPDQTRGGMYTNHGCFGLEGVDLFDNKFFEISPAEAKGMDPVQRQVMEVSYVSLMEGGWEKKSLQRQSENIGHFVGIDKDDWSFMGAIIQQESGGFGASSAAMAIVANRFSYSCNLKGASMQIDTACSSSLVCLHVSKLHLRHQEFDPMPACIINGVNLMLAPGPFLGCCGANMLSHEGRCFTFNATADGYARGELCSSICTKRAQYDPSIHLACVAGTQANQDGRSASMTAPNGPAQERCINAVLRETKLTPTEIDCIECHGTGTALGDPIEVGAFRKVMSATARNDPMVITSSKSNIGHGEGGAGLAGFIKCAAQVGHTEACPNLHLKVLNPHLDLDGFPCQTLSEKVVFREDSGYTGVSSFGFGGTNGHAEAWGRNIFTSRGAFAADPYKMFQKKLSNAPPGEISIEGDDIDDWETTGIDPRCSPSDKYEIQMDNDGVASWEKVDDDADYGDEFFIQGTFSNWESEPMDPHSSIPGLWVGTITVGASGEEQFQIMADNDKAMVYTPTTAKCTLKASPIVGPAESGKEMTWLVKGKPESTYTIEWFQQGKNLSIMWLKG